MLALIAALILAQPHFIVSGTHPNTGLPANVLPCEDGPLGPWYVPTRVRIQWTGPENGTEILGPGNPGSPFSFARTLPADRTGLYTIYTTVISSTGAPIGCTRVLFRYVGPGAADDATHMTEPRRLPSDDGGSGASAVTPYLSYPTVTGS